MRNERRQAVPTNPLDASSGLTTFSGADCELTNAINCGDKVLIRARAGLVTAVDLRARTARIEFIPQNAVLYRATAWQEVSEGETVEPSEFVNVMVVEDEEETPNAQLDVQPPATTVTPKRLPGKVPARSGQRGRRR